MAICPVCKSDKAYYPFYGPVECINPFCKFYSEVHSQAIQNEEIKQLHSTGALKPKGQIRFDWNASGWSPYNIQTSSSIITTTTNTPSTPFDDGWAEFINHFIDSGD